MSILEKLIAIAAPHRCIGCNLEGVLLCLPCSQALRPAAWRCYRCQSNTISTLICSNCSTATGVSWLFAATAYKGLAKELIWRLKFNGAQAASQSMAQLMVYPDLPPNVIVTYIPTATSRVRQRGYDQAALLARGVAGNNKATFAPLLARSGQQHQRGASRQQRLTQLESAFRVINYTLVKDAHILLIDDVATTGASLQAASQTLLTAGARRVDAAVFAQA